MTATCSANFPRANPQWLGERAGSGLGGNMKNEVIITMAANESSWLYLSIWSFHAVCWAMDFW